MEYILNGNRMNTCMIGTWAWGTGAGGGKMIFGGSYDRERLAETFRTAYDAGFTFLDTAEIYGQGSSERLLGELIKEKQVTLSTKHFPSKRYKSGECRRALEGSLKRLGVDSVDLYWLHSPQHIREHMTDLAECVRDGLIKGVGLSNGSAEQIMLADQTLKEHGCRLTAVQNHYSLLAMEREEEPLRYCAENGILFFGYMILEQGALSGHYDINHRFKKLSLRGMAFGKSKFRKISGLIEYIRRLGETHRIDSAQIPIAWAVSKGVIPIIGMTSPRHALSLSEGLNLQLAPEEIANLEKLALDSRVKCKGIWE